MNKPAQREPSMDEILSSIRQIIADDDGTPGPGESELGPRPASPAPASAPPAAETEPAPLALSSEQIVGPGSGAPEGDAAAFARDLADDADEVAQEIAAAGDEGPIGFDESSLVHADDIAFEAGDEPVAEAPDPQPRSRAEPVGRAAPLPDPKLSEDIAEQLLAPASEAAVRHTFSRLGAMSIGTPGVTVEAMMREMLRPMLKEWLDEHLPSVVERMVEREIARISRGGD